MPRVLAIVTLRWGEHVIASHTAREGRDIVVSGTGEGAALASLPPDTPGHACKVRIVGDTAVITIPAGCEARRHAATSAHETLPSRTAESRLALRPGHRASVGLGRAGTPPAPLTLDVQVTEGTRVRFLVPVSLFASGRGHLLAVGVLHAAFLLWSFRVTAVDMDESATIDLAAMQAALERAEMRQRGGMEYPPERFTPPSGPIQTLDAPRSTLLETSWTGVAAARLPTGASALGRDLDDGAAYVLPSAPATVE